MRRVINESIAKRPADLLVTMHICRGNFQSTYFSSGGYEEVSEIIFGGLDVDGLFLEFDDERSGSFEPLRHVNRPDLSVVLGLITSKFGELENPESIKERITEASKYVPLEQLCLKPTMWFRFNRRRQSINRRTAMGKSPPCRLDCTGRLEITIAYDFKTLMKSGGGTGPMKPGNHSAV